MNLNDEKPTVENLVLGIALILLGIIYSTTNYFQEIYLLLLIIPGVFLIITVAVWKYTKEQNLIDWLIKRPIRFFLLSFIICFIIVLFLDIFYLKDIEGILVESHGLVFDLIVFGIILTLYEQFKNRSEKIDRYLEELDDYRGLDSREAAYRVAGIIKRLKKEDFKDFSLNNLHLGKADKETILKAIENQEYVASYQGSVLFNVKLKKIKLDNTNFKDAFFGSDSKITYSLLRLADFKRTNFNGCDLSYSNLFGSDFSNTMIWEANLENCTLVNVNFTDAFMVNVNLTNANLKGANLENANLEGADFTNTNLKGANLENANLRGADFTNTKGLTYEQLKKVKTLRNTKGINPSLLRKLKLINSKLFSEPTIEKLEHNKIKYEKY